jgi:hypothetical protein
MTAMSSFALAKQLNGGSGGFHQAPAARIVAERSAGLNRRLT